MSRKRPLINRQVQATAAEKAILRYVRRYVETLEQAGLSREEADREAGILMAAVLDKVRAR
jgi:hypothetical protein